MVPDDPTDSGTLAPQYEKPDEVLTWTVSTFDGKSNSAQGCAGKSTNTQNGIVDSLCTVPSAPSSCIQGVVNTGFQACAIYIYSDTKCKTAIPMYDENPGIFGKAVWNANLIAVTPTFGSYDVHCFPK